MALPVRRTDAIPWDPTTELSLLTQRLSRLLDNEAPNLPFPLGQEGFTPRADLEETDDAFLLEVELPGVKKKDIAIEVVGRQLVITGDRPERPRLGWLRRQTRSAGSFRYEVTFPVQVEDEHVEARLDEGVLHVKVPKSTSAARRRIEVR